MALTINQITAITREYFLEKAVDNIFNSNALWQRGKSKFYRSVSGGTIINVPLAYAVTTASGWFVGLQTLDTTDNQQLTAAQFRLRLPG